MFLKTKNFNLRAATAALCTAARCMALGFSFCALMASLIWASPFLISDASQDSEVTVWQLDVDGTLLDPIPGTSINYDLVDISPGLHTIKARFGAQWVADEGETYEWSEWSVPFAFTRPIKPSVPTGQKLQP